MTTEVEFWFWSVAKIFVERHGTDAPIHAAMRADDLLDAGELDGSADAMAESRQMVGESAMRE